MRPPDSWTGTEVPEHKVGGEIRLDLARAMVIKALSERQGRLSLPSVRRSVSNLTSRTLARTLRNAALDGILRIEGNDVYLTPLGQRVAKSL